MTVSEIGALAERLFLYEPIDDDDFLVKAVSQGQRLLPVVAYREASVNINIAEGEENTWKDLPADFVQATEITESGEAYSLYTIRDGKIRFQDSGTYSVRYRKYPAELAAVTNSPEVREAYHPVLARYVAAQYQLAVAGDQNSYALTMQEFYAEAARVAADLRRASRSCANAVKVERSA